ncbi:hypothetical protein [Vitiosangium sp. GDMCC 1.1324]|uniref:hypothetical protein n=1 Tax=Vitiosangium sp. (strain GDMCC 1.1324) TaxID=2138576 RepID=UPI0011B6577E|nr:hypothetical protein [Vitiosangium sp. GDMCC 1.1324]
MAFGVLGSKHKPCFVARGKVHAHLDDFITRMTRDNARVDLYARPPLPGWLLKKYADDPHHEGHEFEAPPPPPVNGLVAGSTTSYEHRRHTPLWPEGPSSARHVFIMPIHRAPSEFLALGVSGSGGQVIFALTGSVQKYLGEFISRVVKEEAQVELRARPPLPEPILRKYLSEPSAENSRR